MTTIGHDPDPQETQEWRDALAGVIAAEGPERAAQLLAGLADDAKRAGVPFSSGVGGKIVTPYVNTIAVSEEPAYPGDIELERKIEAAVRWNAMALVVRANKVSSELGGHVASYASAATLYEVAFNHFFRAAGPNHGGDLVFFQGHSSPGFYARAFMEGRLDQAHMDNFRQEVGGQGLSSYPHPWLMPNFWQFPTVSMGLAPIMSIYQARFMKYLDNRELIDAGDRNVWTFLGDGEMDEPESLGQITIAAREGLDNLKWVVNCNLQRLDGPVRGNGKIIQELEGVFRGAGWNVIKVVWGSNWDPLFASDPSSKLLQLVDETLDGNYQSLRAGGAKATRDEFFGKYPETAALIAGWDDARISALRRGGHDPKKVYAAYARAMERNGRPTVILAKTIKGFGMGSSGEGQNVAHQAKKMHDVDLRNMRDAFGLPIPDADLATVPFYKPDEKSPEMQYFRERLAALGSVPQRRRKSTTSLAVPELSAFKGQLEATGERHISTTMAFVRVLSALLKDKTLGKHIVPIVADESRTFGMEGLFRQLGIYSHVGQNYTPQDADQLMWYREDKKGQILQEGIDEAGATSSWIAAGTSYSNHDLPMIPFYIYYSMFGFQRVGDLMWAAGDIRTRGFLIGGTSGRTTLNGEGLQHEDGQSQIMASFVPNCVSYDPTYSFELAVIIRDGLRRMVAEQEDVYYYITLMNENYEHPAMPAGAEEGILRGMHLLRDGGKGKKAPRVQLLGSGSILREVEAAADLLRDDFGVVADVWSATSFNELRRDGIDVERWNLLHPTEKARVSYVAQCLEGHAGPAIAATDYIRTYADAIRPYLDRRYVVLGTDGFGRSDFRTKLRTFFEVNRHYVAIAALKALADDGEIPASKVAEAIVKYGIDPSKPNPVTV